MRGRGWERCRALPAARRGIPEGSGPGPPGLPSPPAAQPGASPARKSPSAGTSCSRFLPASPGTGEPAGAPSPRLQRGKGNRAGDAAPGLAGGSHRAPGGGMPGSSWELLGNLPALPRAKSRHIKGGRRQREPGQEPLVPGSPRLQRPRSSHRPPRAPGRHSWLRGRAPSPGMAPGPSLWQPPPAPGVFSAPGPPWEPGRVPPHSAGLSGPPL